MTGKRLHWIVGSFFILSSGLILTLSFWKVGNEVRDALVLTSYVTQIPSGQKQSFGHGGEGEAQRVDVAFQGPEMSNVCFIISRDDSGNYWIMGQDDGVLLRRVLYPPRQQVELKNKETFEAVGLLGRAAFTAFVDQTSDTLRLQLRTPIFREVRTSPTRLTFADTHHPLPHPIDEIFFRTSALSGTMGKTYRIWLQRQGLYMEEEQDLAVKSTSSINPPTEQISTRNGLTDLLKSGESRTVGTVEFSFRQYATPPESFLGLSWIKLFGLRLFLAMLLVGLAYLIGSQAHWPTGALTIFGCAAALSSAGLVLAARDFFFYPHQQRFQEYLSVLFWASVFLFALRVPFNPQRALSIRKFYFGILRSFACFLVAYFLINSSFDSRLSISSALYASSKVFLAFVLSLTISLTIQVGGRKKLLDLSDLPWSDSRFRLWLLVPLLLLVSSIIVARFLFGGLEAITLVGIRIHLPTLMLPIMVLWISILTWVSEIVDESRDAWLVLSVVSAFLVVLIYRLSSHDNGGSAILTAGVLATLWLGSSKKGIPAAATLIALGVGMTMAWLSQSGRFELAWGGEEGRMLFYDGARNLRLARDMARAGGAFGQFLTLPIPAELRSNIHTDLVGAYVIGFFGWIVSGILLVAYALFYNFLFAGLYGSLFAASKTSETTTTQSHQPRAILLLVAGALILTFLAQTLWVLLATLLSFVPLTGLDLQPISSSTISILSFFVILVGSVALSHTFNETLPI